MMRKWDKETWKKWLSAQSGTDNVVKALIGIVLVFLLIGIAAATVRFLWSAFVLVGLIAIALVVIAKLREQGRKIPIRIPVHQNRKGRPERSEARRKRFK